MGTLSPHRETIYRAIRGAAQRDLPCPSNTELAELCGITSSYAATLIQVMAREGRFQIEKPASTRDIIFPDGLQTTTRHKWIACRDAVAQAFGVPPYKIVAGGKLGPTIRARHATAWVLNARFPDASLHEIGQVLGGRDHSTVLNSLRRAEILRSRDLAFREITDALAGGEITLEAGATVTPIKPAPVQNKPEPAAPAPPSVSWCDQCQSRVSADMAAGCSRAFCSLRQDVAA